MTLRRKPSIATTHTGLIGLVTVASCCFPLFAKSVFPYYLLEPYVFAVLWWLAGPDSARTWRALVPLLLTVDVFILKATLISPLSGWGVVGGTTSSAVLGVAVALVTFDLLHSTEDVAAHRVRHDRPPQRVPAVQE